MTFFTMRSLKGLQNALNLNRRRPSETCYDGGQSYILVWGMTRVAHVTL